VQGMMGGGGSTKITSLKKLFNKAHKAAAAEDDNCICGTCKYLRSYRCV
jgi:hypothetical protein